MWKMGGTDKGAWWKAFVPHYITNRQLLWFYGKAAKLFRVPEAEIAGHRRENRKLLRGTESPLKGGYIENQAEWGKVRFGCSKRSNMAYSGCEVIATYNAKLALGEPVGRKDMEALIARYEKRGAALWGAIGTSPREIALYFEECGYRVRFTDSADYGALEEMGEKSDAVIVTAYNDREDITAEIHTVTITRDGGGEYILHNAYAYDRGIGVYVAKGGYPTLQEAVRNMASAPAVICMLGISGKDKRKWKRN